MADETTEAPAALPATLDELDALRLENRQLKAEKARAEYEAAVSAFQAEFAAQGAKYQFDCKTARVDFGTRAIIRG